MNQPSADGDEQPVFHVAEDAHVSTAKTRIDSEKVLEYVQTEVDPSIAHLIFIVGGEGSQAFSFERAGEWFVIRVHRDRENFEKDAYAADHFSSDKLPIPQVLNIGTMTDGHSICITRKVEGIALSDFDHAQTHKLMPRVMDMLDAIHAAPIPQGGYGWIDGKGHARCNTWSESLLSIETDSYYDWANTIRDTCMEASVQVRLMIQLQELVPRMPNARTLVHGDVGMDNALSDGEKITGVIDWANAQYGDPLFDVAWLHVWWKKVPFAELYRQHAEKNEIVFEEYETRLKCYATHIGLGALGFFAKSNQPKKYEWLKKRLGEMGVL